MSIFISSLAWADWQAYSIQGAKCADGSAYRIFIDWKEKSEKLNIEFMGGGACWDLKSCLSTTWIWRVPSILKHLSLITRKNLRPNASKVFLPYCTGDVYAAQHVADYDGKKISHFGYVNARKSIQFLKKLLMKKNYKINDLLVFGSSAGAIGALTHIKNLEKSFRHVKTKKMIIDSPGLHWSDEFFHKFSSHMFKDFQSSFRKLNIEVTNGFIAPLLPRLCSEYSGWKMKFLQASRDIVMSEFFDRIGKDKHQQLVHSSLGFKSIFQTQENCSVFIADSIAHTFLLLKPFSLLKGLKGNTAWQSVISFIHSKS